MFARVLIFLAALLANPLSFSWAQKLPENNSCINCHSEMVDELKDSVHFQHGIYCNSCHGGDPSQKDKEAAKAPATGYVGVPDKKQIAQICGNCHADVEAMNFYGLRTDQLARYKTSRHGKKLLEGDTKVAVCSDCHGYHDVLPVSDPNGPAYPANIPKTCNRCHGNERIMAPYGKPTDIFDKYKNSVHGKALFEKKDMGAATCVSCHGNHGAIPPGVKDISEACGKCHINERTNFLESVHFKMGDKIRFPQCIACHSNHDIQPASLEMYTKACGRCHEPKSKAYAYGQTIWKQLQGAREDLREAQDIVRQAGIDGIFVEEETALLEDVKTKVNEMGPVQHTLSYEKIDALYKEAKGKTEEIKTDIHKKRERLKQHKLVLWPLWTFIIVMSIAFYMKYEQLKSADKEKKEKQDE